MYSESVDILSEPLTEADVGLTDLTTEIFAVAVIALPCVGVLQLNDNGSCTSRFSGCQKTALAELTHHYH